MYPLHFAPVLDYANSLQMFIAWLAGARFDIIGAQFKEQMGDLLGMNSEPAQVTKVHVTSDHSEL